jgi:hypothetical protein
MGDKNEKFNDTDVDIKNTLAFIQFPKDLAPTQS